MNDDGVSCGSTAGVVCPLEGKYTIVLNTPAKFSLCPFDWHPHVELHAGPGDATEMFLNVFQGKAVLFFQDKTTGPFFFVYQDADKNPLAICTQQVPIPAVLEFPDGRWTAVDKKHVRFLSDGDAGVGGGDASGSGCTSEK